MRREKLWGACINSIPRFKTRRLKLAGKWENAFVGGGSPITVQSMTTTRTYNVDETLSQINDLYNAKCDIIRISCPTEKDAKSLPLIIQNSPIPVITDIHFQVKYVFDSIDAGAAGVRINPGNIKNLGGNLEEIVKACRSSKTPLRIGVNAGSLDDNILRKHNMKITPEALVDSAVSEAREFEKLGFYDFAISVKHHNVLTMIKAYEILSKTLDYPLHLGVTEAGPEFAGSVKSAVAFGALLKEGIGDTIRVSLSSDPIKEVEVGLEILRSLELRKRDYEIISCPTCGRKEADIIELTKIIEPKVANHENIKNQNRGVAIAVMGCIVNGPGEAREADIGIAGGRDSVQFFAKGQFLKRVKHDQIESELMSMLDIITSDKY